MRTVDGGGLNSRQEPTYKACYAMPVRHPGTAWVCGAITLICSLACMHGPRPPYEGEWTADLVGTSRDSVSVCGFDVPAGDDFLLDAGSDGPVLRGLGTLPDLGNCEGEEGRWSCKETYGYDLRLDGYDVDGFGSVRADVRWVEPELRVTIDVGRWCTGDDCWKIEEFAGSDGDCQYEVSVVATRPVTDTGDSETGDSGPTDTSETGL